MPETPRGVDVGDAVCHRAQVGDAHRRAGLPVIAGDDGRVVAGFEDLIVVADLPAMVGVLKAPLGRLALASASAVRTASRPMPLAPNCMGFNSTRTAGLELPPTKTWPTPSICEIFCARMESAMS